MTIGAPRTTARIVQGQPASDGAGVKLRRILGGPGLDHLDPFLLLDEFRSDDPRDYLAGFPDHPHRGFETVTYMLAGAMRHRDHVGHEGHLRAGSVQWMTAGRGIVHSEMPEQVDGLMWGFQLWVNLPAAQKMRPPRYQDIPPEDIPERDLPGGARVRVVAGRSGDVVGPVRDIAVAPTFLDAHLPPGARFEHPVPASHNAFCYPYEGRGRFGVTPDHPGEDVHRGHLVVLGDGDGLVVQAPSDAPLRFLLVAGEPIREPIARYGPFVMNSRDEILQAFRDFQSGRLEG
ncbi:MAG: pirin family protein [Myxococcota bacterium]